MTHTPDDVRKLAQALLHHGLGPLNDRERRMIARIARRVQVHDLDKDLESRATFGERLADRVAALGGSWGFILGFCVFMFGWAGLNAFILVERAFDPYPFVFLNLLLSMLAALQAPIIMMSQNRQAAKDRLAAARDYEVNLKAEVGVMVLNEKMDRLEQWLGEMLEARKASTGDVVMRGAAPGAAHGPAIHSTPRADAMEASLAA